jgi:hypothetical protein
MCISKERIKMSEKIKIPVKEKCTLLNIDFFYPREADIIKHNNTFFVLEFVNGDMYVGIFFESEKVLKETLEKLLKRVSE